MNLKNDRCATPVNRRTRSLGLRKTSSLSCGPAIKYQSLKEPTAKPAQNVTEATTSTPVRSAADRLTASTNCRPYRLALSKTMRDKLTKKRLEFHLANDAAQAESVGGDSRVEAAKHTVLPTLTASDEVQIVEAAKDCIQHDVQSKEQQKPKQLDEELRHKAKVKELRTDIEMWRTAFVTALDELHQTQPFEPKKDKAALLQQLQVPLEMLQYVDE